ncbi:glucose-1-phosphatase-like [Anticarsia gemmatalis]|uniref:glucose-1-phosphatase-like n=1 Tax=Anticarsia gemmatalis TaxID=129554 RepID=UPI003F774A0C
MGEFFSSWLIKEGLLTKNCPDENSFYVYANTAQRTMASAQSFISKAFPQCNITIHHASDTQRDPIFNPVVHNSSKAFRTEAIEEMKTLLKSLHLNSSYEDLQNILDYKESKYCVIKHKCDFITDPNKVFVNTGFKPNLEGPLKICKSVIDSFIMENYEGFPINEVAWGSLQDVDQWDAILGLTRGYHDVIFNTTLIAQDLAKPLLKFITELLLKRQAKVTLLMGHDANIYTVLKSMGFKPYTLEKQYEMTPAGGKIVIQKWGNNTSGNMYAKIDYVYQGTDQMREGKALSLNNPPEVTMLKLEGCVMDDNGFCLWDDFVKLLNGLIGNV